MSENRQLPRQVLVRLSTELAAAIEIAAAGQGMSSAGWLRELAAGALSTAATPRDLQPSPPRDPPPKLTPLQADMRALVRHLGILGGSVVQLTKLLREGRRPEHPDAEGVLSELRAASVTARRLLQRCLW